MREDNGDIYDEIEAAAGGDIGPTLELLGQTFTLVDFELQQTRFIDEKTGENRITHIATVALEGGSEEERPRYWLGGFLVNRQLAAIREKGIPLPLLLKLGGKGTKESPYMLLRPDGTASSAVASLPEADSEENPKDSPLVKRAKKAGATEVVTVRRKDGEQADMPWADFCGLWQGEGYGLDELGDICGATSAQALTHWFAADKGRTITVLKVEATKRRKPLEEEKMPFE